MRKSLMELLNHVPVGIDGWKRISDPLRRLHIDGRVDILKRS